MDAKRLVLTRLLPKTGQEIYYTDGDDGYYYAGWWKGRSYANNKTRFITKTLDGDDVVIDLATGLMWAADGNAAGCKNGSITTWGGALSYAEALDFAGFTDWRLPNIRELFSIVDFGRYNPAIDETFFRSTYSEEYWSSTTFTDYTGAAWYILFTVGLTTYQAKYQPNRLRCVRGRL